jgi:hypothetical protein
MPQGDAPSANNAAKAVGETSAADGHLNVGLASFAAHQQGNELQ